MGQEPRQQSRRKLEVFVSGLGGIRAFISPLAGLFVALGHTLPPSDGQALGQLDFDLRQEHPFLYTTLEIRRALVTVCPRIVSCTSLLSLLDRVDTFPFCSRCASLLFRYGRCVDRQLRFGRNGSREVSFSSWMNTADSKNGWIFDFE